MFIYHYNFVSTFFIFFTKKRSYFNMTLFYYYFVILYCQSFNRMIETLYDQYSLCDNIYQQCKVCRVFVRFCKGIFRDCFLKFKKGDSSQSHREWFSHISDILGPRMYFLICLLVVVSFLRIYQSNLSRNSRSSHRLRVYARKLPGHCVIVL